MTSFAPSRRTVLTGLAASPLLGFSTIVAAQTQPLRSSAFASFGAAVATWARRGGTLIVDRDHIEQRPVELSCVPGLAYHLTSDAPRRISYAGPHYSWLFSILGRGGNPLRIDGDLDFDGRGACSIPFFARFELVSGNARRDCTVSGLTARGARMRSGLSQIDGSDNAGYGATAMQFGGGFDRLHLSDVGAFDVSREASAGRPGNRGSIGIGIVAYLGTTSSARHITVEDFAIERINADDRPGPARWDMDGLLVFQSNEASGSRPIVRRGTIREAAGRAVKVYAPGGGGSVSQLSIHRSVAGMHLGSVDIDIQHGDGAVEAVRLFYSGQAHATPTIPISMTSNTVRAPGFPFREGIIRDIVINDTTGRAKRALIGLQYGQRDSTPRRFQISDITDHGSANHLVLPGALGTFAPATVRIEQASVNLIHGLLATEDPAPQFTLLARNLTNRNARPAPVRTDYTGRIAPHMPRVRLDRDASVRGFGD